ncbi:ABC1 kinase family protein [Maribacter sp. ACAM166]|uniref:ABC1 kinase family protein n=1 Tax=Maribacter sp. ACAM166 TaxID=2508996 RepID=UPI0010FE8109|nr:AarF/UbiB family protein [Maribacter sp. ACAM166]TLP73985.1 AarF/ABC1/UbiB kinase family protein [Maribacter sp. ACAM166]
MKTLDNIPTGKIERASKLVSTGAKIGGNYAKYFSKKIINPEITRDELNENNATDIYDGLKSLKGSALKVAQMLSMEKNLLPTAYVDKFSLSQFSVPPLSAPLVRKTFKKYLGKYPEEVFDTFEKESINAASIGQVHKATKDGRNLAVKIQYPGIAQSISSDLALVKPIAMRMFNLKGKDSDKYFREVEYKLIEETNYWLELTQSKEITEACKAIAHMKFPNYYEDLSSERIITMDWMTGIHLGEFTKTDFSQKTANKLGQALWDFYMFQIHGLRKVHADPHPGNFLVNDNEELIAIDFGCIKEVPDSFYIPYFELAKPASLSNDTIFTDKLYELEILVATDKPDDIIFFKSLFHELLSLFTSPFHKEEFDFGNEVFWGQLADLGEHLASDKQIRKMNGNRGSKHFLYMNRTFFGLYNLLHDLRANINVNNYKKYLN